MSELQRALAAAAEALAAEKTARRDESAAAAAEIAQLTERLTAAEATRHSDMSDISWPDIYESRMREDVQPDLERGETPSPLVGGAGRWSEELTLFQPWRSHTLKDLSQDCIAYWTDSHEAEFRDGMYHSSFRFRIFVMSSTAFLVCLMVLVDPCLTMLGVLTCVSQLLLLWTQIAAQRMGDKRRGRQLGQWSLILLSIGFDCSMVPLAQYFFDLPTWKEGTCKVAADDELGFIAPRTMCVINFGFGSMPILFGAMITLMTISTRGFVTVFTGVVITDQPGRVGCRPGLGEADAQLYKRRHAERACASAGGVSRTRPASQGMLLKDIVSCFRPFVKKCPVRSTQVEVPYSILRR